MAGLGKAGLAGDSASPNANAEEALARSKALTLKLRENHPTGPRHVGATESARRLVKGIARNHEVTLFTPHGLTGDGDDPSMIIHDLLVAIGVPPRIVNVGADTEMHLGLPHGPDGVDLPHLYVKTVAIGGPADVLSMAQSGALAQALTQAKIAFDADAAAALRTDD